MGVDGFGCVVVVVVGVGVVVVVFGIGGVVVVFGVVVVVVGVGVVVVVFIIHSESHILADLGNKTSFIGSLPG